MLADYRTAPIPPRLVALLALVEQTARNAGSVSRADIERVRSAGWSDEAIYDAITVCALFNFYNTWVEANGVSCLPPDGYAASGNRLATAGYRD